MAVAVAVALTAPLSGSVTAAPDAPPHASVEAVAPRGRPSAVRDPIPARLEPASAAAPTTGVDDESAAPTGELPDVRPAGAVFLGPPPAPRTRSGIATGRTSRASALGLVALDSIDYPWRSSLPAWRIRFADGSGPLRGVTDPDRRRITVYVGPGDTLGSLARVIAHELGHAVDLTHNDTGSRRAWKQRRGIGAGVAWWPTPGVADFATGSGDFAECFATLQVGSRSRSPYGRCRARDLAIVAATSGASP